MNLRSLLMVSVSVLLLGGCGRTDPPAPVVRYGAGAPEGAGVVSAREGDTVYTIASFYNVPVRDVIDANNIAPPYKLAVGQRIRIPAPQEYRVQIGDTVYSISRSFAVEQSQLVKSNNIQWPYYLKPGQVLRLPHASSNAASIAVAETVDPVYAPSAVSTSGPAGSGFETTPVAPSPEAVTSEALPPPPSSASSAVTTAPQQQAAIVSPQPPVPPPAASATGSTAPAKSSVSAAAISSTGKFVWPVQGRILSAYGSKPDGLHNDGINIAAPRGTAVRAADAGVVAYVGNDLPSYGNLVLVRHANGWMTAYGHLNKPLVSKGDTIAQGQALGTIGTTGSVDSPQLHFEIRQGSKALDPQKYLGATG